MRLYDPLILKTASQNFSGREFPADPRQFNSTHLFEQRLDELEKQPTGRLQIAILREYTALLWNNFTDSIPIDTLQDAYENTADEAHSFAGKIFSGDTFRYTEAFISLLDEGVLRIEKGFRKELRFVYERFNEFLFARHFIITESSSPVFRKIPIEAESYENVLRAAGHSTVMIAALRNALIIDFYQKQHDPATIIQLALSQLYEAQPLVEETLSVLTDENYSDVLGILEYMLEFEKKESAELLKKRTDFEELLQSPKKSARLSEGARKELEDKLEAVNEQIFKILKVRQIAVSVVYKIYKSENINDLVSDEKTDPGKLLWLAMADPLPEVRDNASIYIYYIARYNPDLGKGLILTLSDKVKSTPVFSLFKQSSRKELQQSYIEPACRVGLFLVIDGLIERKDYAQALEIMNVWKEVVRKFTLNHTIIKIVMPFFKFLFSRQTVVQTEYVNNAIEYRYFWDHIPLNAPSPQWSRTVFKELVPFFDPATTNFSQYEQQIINGYRTGDSFSFFLLERILIVQGLVDWNNVSGLIQQLINLPETEKYKPYIEMSLIYSLFQINHKSELPVPAAENVFSSLVLSWCLKNKGFFYAHYNDKANGGKPYKQYVLYWYAAAYCHRYGDGKVKEGDGANVPVFRELIYTSYKQRDKVLLYNCIENMAVMVSAMGYYKTSLQLFEYLISLFNKESEIREFDNIKIDVSPVYNVGLRSFICDMLGTVKSYFPKEVDHFIVNKLKNSGFPGLDAFREEIFNHSLSHEGIGDLLTHKFGNFVMWGILNDIHIRKFFIEIYNFSIVSKNYPEWFDYCIRHIFQEVFDVKNLQKAFSKNEL